jgi:hypothetical protein
MIRVFLFPVLGLVLVDSTFHALFYGTAFDKTLLEPLRTASGATPSTKYATSDKKTSPVVLLAGFSVQWLDTIALVVCRPAWSFYLQPAFKDPFAATVSSCSSDDASISAFFVF